METKNGGKTESKANPSVGKGGLRRGAYAETERPAAPELRFDYEYMQEDLTVGKKTKAALTEKKPDAKEQPETAEIKETSVKKDPEKGKKHPHGEKKPEKHKKPADKPENAKAAEEKKHRAKHPRGVEEDGLDTSSVAVARGISHEARRRKQNLHDLLRLGIILLLIAVIVGGGILAYRWTTVKTISVTGSEKYGQAQLMNMSRIRTGRNILFYNEKKLADDMNAIPDIRIVSVKKKLPNTIDIVVADIVPCAAIEASGGSFSFISEDGYVLSMGEKDPGGLIVVRGMTGEGITPGTYIDKQNPTLRTTCAVKLIKAIRASSFAESVRAIDVSSSVCVTLTLDSAYTIVLGSLATADECVGTAAKAYAKFLPVYPNGGTINVFHGKTQVDFTPNK